MSLNEQGILFKIQNSQIRQKILQNVPFTRLMQLFQYSHSHQQLININISSYKYLSNIEPTSYNLINNYFRKETSITNPNKYLEKTNQISFLLDKPQIQHFNLDNPNFKTLCYFPSVNNIIFVGANKSSFLFNNRNETHPLHGLSFPIETFFSCIEISPMYAAVVSGCIIHRINLSNGFDDLIALFNQKEIRLNTLARVSDEEFITSTTQGDVYVYNINQNKQIHSFHLSQSINELKPLLNTSTLFTCYANNVAYILDIKKETFITTFDHHTSIIFAITPLSCREQIVSADSSGVIKVWDYSGREEMSFQGNKCFVNILLELPNESLVSAGNHNQIHIWDINNGRNTFVLEEHDKPIIALLVLRNKRLISSGLDRMICIWNCDNGLCEVKIKQMLSSPKCFVQTEDETVYYVNLRGEGQKLTFNYAEIEDYYDSTNNSISFIIPY